MGRYRTPLMGGSVVILVSMAAWAQPAPVGSEFQVNTYTTNAQQFENDHARQQACFAANGDFVVVWESYAQDGDAEGVFGQRYASSGSPVGTEFQVNTYTTAGQEDPGVCCGQAGDFVVVWESDTQDGDEDGIFGQRYGSNGSPAGTEFRVNTYTTDRQEEVTVCCNQAGDFIVAWESDTQDGDSEGVFGQRFAASGSPAGTEFRANTYTTSDQDQPAVCCDASGNFVVTWESEGGQDGDNSGVFGQRYDSGGAPAGTEFQVNSYTTGSQADASVCCDDNGGFVVIWENDPAVTAEEDILAQRFASSGSPQGTEFVVNTYTTGDQEEGSICCIQSGEFVVVWEDQFGDGDGDGILGQAFTSTGVRIGKEFLANTYTTNDQGDPAVACGPAGRLVVAWDSDGQDGNNIGVFAQRFVLQLFGTTAPALTQSVLGVLALILVGLGHRALRRRGRTKRVVE